MDSRDYTILPLIAPNPNLVYPTARIWCWVYSVTRVAKKSVIWYVSRVVDGYITRVRLADLHREQMDN
jgi:hypothetical protein